MNAAAKKKKVGRRLNTSDYMSPKSPVVKAINYVILTVFVLMLFSPILIIFFASFKSNHEYMYTSLMQPPESFLNFENYITAFVDGKMLVGFKNTLILSAASILGSVTMGSMVAYALGRFEFRARKYILGLYTLAVMVPGITTQIATFTVIRALGVYNTIYAGILLYLATDITQIYILLQFTRSIPKEVDESALIDGASYFRIYRSIILPLMKPAIVTVVILKFVGVYNDMFIPMMYMPKSSLRTVTTAIMSFSYDKSSQWNVMSAAIFLVLVPALILYLVFQKHIIAGVTNGAVKE